MAVTARHPILLAVLATQGLFFPASASAIPPAVPGGERWIAYAPTGYFPAESPPVLPSRESLRADLRVLREAGFTGIVTYGAEIPAIPEIAHDLGFHAMLLGIWDPFDARERAEALRAVAVHKDFIAGIVVGNEGLTSGRYTIDRLCKAMSEIRVETQKPVSTTESVDFVLSERKIGECSDFITVNTHPYWSNEKAPDAAVRWTLEAWEAVRKCYPAKPVLFKEVGLPTAGDEAVSEKAQEEYYMLLAASDVKFVYFEAFDARFKQGAIEQSWGLWDSDRTPKSVVGALPWRRESR